MVRSLLILTAALAACTSPAPRPPAVEPLTRPTPPRPCERFEAEISCPPLARLSTQYGPLSEEGIVFCELTCVTAEGTRDGAFALYNAENQTLITAGTYTADKKSGTWLEYGENHETFERVTVSEIGYLDGERHGLARRWHDNGALASTGAWVAGQPDGDWETYAPDGTWLSRAAYDQGVPIGIHLERYLNGQLTSKRSYDERGRPDGEWCFWQSDGTSIHCQTISGGTGRLTEYDRKGEIARISELRDGKLHGSLTEYTYDTRYVAEYVDGEQHGLTTVFVGDCPEQQSVWARGKLDGPHTEIDCDSLVVVRRGQYCDDEMCGRWELRDGGTGILTETTDYSDDGELLSRVLYNEDGQIDRF